jgi:MFS family permease
MGKEPRIGDRFATLWAAGTSSALGSGLTAVATPLLVATFTDNPLTVAGASAATWLPWLLFALPTGVLADRVERQRLMVRIDALRVAATIPAAVAVALGHASVALLYALLFMVNTGEVAFRSASQAVVPDMVPLAQAERANGWLLGGATLMQQMVAGPFGGLLFAAAAAAPFFASGAAYACSAVLLGLLGTVRAPGTGPPSVAVAPAGPSRSVLREVCEGAQWLVREKLLLHMAVVMGLLNLTLTAAMAVLVLLARQRLNLGPVGYGLLFTSLALGALGGALLGDRIIRRATATWTIRVGLLVEAGTHLTLATSRNAYLTAAVLFVFGVHGSLFGIVGNSLRQRLTPPHLLGRVGGTSLFVAAGGNCLGALLGGVMAGALGLTAPYWAGLVVALAVSAVTWRTFDRATMARAYVPPPALPTDRATAP